MQNSKRGISDLIATVLLILIVIAAVGIIWAGVAPLFRKGLDKPLACSQIELAVNAEQGYTWYNDAKDVSVMVTAEKVGELKDIQIKISDDAGKSAIFKVKDDFKQNISTSNYEDRTYNISAATLSAKGITGKPKTVTLIPMVIISGTKESCQPGMTVDLPLFSSLQ